jgi:hypothetical protein
MSEFYLNLFKLELFKGEKTDGMNVWLENDMKITENQINLNNENKM